MEEDDIDADESWTLPFTSGAVIVDRSDFRDVNLDLGTIPASKLGHARTIIHFDIDCFYAQVEMLRNPDLRDKPLGIQQKNIIVTSNYEARKWGVSKLSYVTDAKKKCPQLILVSGEDLTHYRQVSYQISEFLQQYTPCVERLGFDENFVDVSQMVTWRQEEGNYKSEFVGHVYESNDQYSTTAPCGCGCEVRMQIGSQIAADIREALQKELGITCCTGIAHNKLLAKLAGSIHKPNQQTAILPHLALELVTSLPSVRSIPGIGSRTSRRLQALEISSIIDLQTCDFRILEREFGHPLAQLLKELSFGIDDTPVVTFSQPQTLSDEDSFKCCKDYSDAESRIKELLTSLLKRVTEDGRSPQTVRLTVRRVLNNYHRESRQCPVPGSIFTKFHKTNSTETACDQLMPIIMSLFSKLVDSSRPFHLTLINICFAKLAKPGDEKAKISSFFTRAVDLPEDSGNQNTDDSLTATCDTSKNTHYSPNKFSGTTKKSRKDKTIMHFFQNTGISSKSSEVESLKTNTQKNSFLKNDNSLGSAHSMEQDNMPQTTQLSLVQSRHRDPEKAPESGEILHLAGSSSQQKKDFPVTQQSTSTTAPDSKFLQADPENLDQADERKSLQTLLPKSVDAQTIAELPDDIKKEVLLQYKILMEDLPEGRRFTYLSDKISTRSRTTETMRVKSKKLFFSPKKKRATKRNLLLKTEDELQASKSKKMLQFEGQSTSSTECFIIPDSQEALSAPEIEHDKSQDNRDKGANSSVIKNSSPSESNVQFDTDCNKTMIGQNKVTLRKTEKGDCDLLCSDPTTGKDLELSYTGQQCSEELKLSRGNEYHISNSPSDTSPLRSQNLQNNTPSSSKSHETSSPSHSNMDQLRSSSNVESPPVNCSHPLKSNLRKSNSDLPDTLSSCEKKETVSSMNVPGSHADLFSELSPPTHKRNVGQDFHKKLPDHIDPEVFSSLPRNIQGEIMAHVMMGTSESGTDVNTTLPNEKRKKGSPTKKGQNTLLTYFKKR